LLTPIVKFLNLDKDLYVNPFLLAKNKKLISKTDKIKLTKTIFIEGNNYAPDDTQLSIYDFIS